MAVSCGSARQGQVGAQRLLTASSDSAYRTSLKEVARRCMAGRTARPSYSQSRTAIHLQSDHRRSAILRCWPRSISFRPVGFDITAQIGISRQGAIEANWFLGFRTRNSKPAHRTDAPGAFREAPIYALRYLSERILRRFLLSLQRRASIRKL
jgi:hypothetical protein